MSKKVSLSVYMCIRGLVCKEENVKKISGRLDGKIKKAEFKH